MPSFCSSHRVDYKLRQQLAEVRYTIPSLNQALTYLNENLDKTVVIDILSLKDDRCPPIEKLIRLQRENPSLYYNFYDFSDLVFYSKQEKDFDSHYFWNNPVMTYNTIKACLAVGVSDICIGEPLAFDLLGMRNNLPEHVRIRVRPHQAMAPMAAVDTEDTGLEHFWVLPQHLYLYEDCVDIWDILDSDSTRENALVKIYLSGSYRGPLKPLLTNFRGDVQTSAIDDDFAARRRTCRQRCMMSPYHCHFCTQHINTINALKGYSFEKS